MLNTLDLTKKGLEFLFFSEQRVQLHHCICFAAKLLKADVCSAFYRDYGIRGTQHANWNIWEVFNLLALRDTEGKLYSACPNTRHWEFKIAIFIARISILQPLCRTFAYVCTQVYGLHKNQFRVVLSCVHAELSAFNLWQQKQELYCTKPAAKTKKIW